MAADVDELVAQAQSGDDTALASLVARYQPLIRAVAFQAAPTGTDEREDAEQEATLEFLVELAKFDPARGTFGAYIKHRMHWWAQRRRRMARRHRATSLVDGHIHHLEGRGVLSAWDDYNLTSEDVTGAFVHLTDHGRRILELTYWKDLPTSAIAEQLGLSNRGVNQVRRRAERRLRQVFDGVARPRGRPSRTNPPITLRSK